MEDTNMKKTYITPELQVVKIAVTQMLAASDRNFSSEDASFDGDGDYED